MRSRYPRNHISKDHYPIKRVVDFVLFAQWRRIIEKSGGIWYNRPAKYEWKNSFVQ